MSDRASIVGISDAEAAMNDSRQQIIGIIQSVLYLVSYVIFLKWFYRVHKNLQNLGKFNLKYTSNSAIWGFFVPFVNLVRPLQVMCEVWYFSDPSNIGSEVATTDGAFALDKTKTPRLVSWWWALLIISGILGNIIIRMALSPNNSIADLQNLSYLLVFDDMLVIPEILLTISIVNHITNWQSEKKRQLIECSL